MGGECICSIFMLKSETVRWQSSKRAPFAQSVVTTTFSKLIIVVVLTILA